MDRRRFLGLLEIAVAVWNIAVMTGFLVTSLYCAVAFLRHWPLSTVVWLAAAFVFMQVAAETAKDVVR